MSLQAVVTTIQSPTPAMLALSRRLLAVDAGLIVVGDRKGPAKFDLPGTTFLSLAEQRRSTFELARIGPVGHYTRKNVGYLEAICRGADCLYETDDDNAPLPAWAPREIEVEAQPVGAPGWVNVYRCFTDGRIWPRGLPLDEVVPSMVGGPQPEGAIAKVRAPIQQGLANGAPDVDAVWRLVLDAPFHFDTGPSVLLRPGSWCPFNSQSTWWWPEAYPLLYLPSHCSFRMTDIWRSFIAQRCLWELGLSIVFHAPEVVQDRNLHNLMRDFADEVPGYQRNRELARILEDTNLTPGVQAMGDNLLRCYGALIARGFFAVEEATLVRAWLEGLELAMAGNVRAE